MAAADIEICRVAPGHRDVRWCFDRYFEEIDRRFETGFDVSEGAGESLDIYAPPMGALLIVRRGDEPVGCGALARRREGFAEIKRMASTKANSDWCAVVEDLQV